MTPRMMRIFGATVAMAMREIRRNPLRSSLTMLGIVIGVSAVIALVTLGRGATAKVTDEVSSMGVNLLTIVPGARKRGPTSTSAPPFTLDDARALTRDLPSLEAVAPTASSDALLVAANRSWNTTITGVSDAYFEVRNVRVALGRRFSELELSGARPSCVLGPTVQRELFGSESALGATIRVGKVACVVVGVTQAKGQATLGMDQDDFVLMPLSAFQRRVAGNDKVDAISVSTRDGSESSAVRLQIVGLMRERRRLADGQSENFAVLDPRELAQTLQSITGALTTLLGAVATVSLLVGGIGIMNIMLVSVTERTREIGLRLAIGARASEVLTQFLIEAVVLCVVGGVAGVMLGLSGSYFVGRVIGLPFTFVPEIIVVAVMFAGCVGLAFGFLPARRASRLNPIQALRHE